MRFIALSILFFLTACGSETAETNAAKRVYVIMLSDKQDTVATTSPVSQQFRDMIQSSIQAAGHQSASYNGPAQSYDQLLQIFNSGMIKNRADYLVILRMHANQRSYGTRTVAKVSVKGDLINMSTGSVERRLAARENQATLPYACSNSQCMMASLAPMLNGFQSQIGAQIIGTLGDRAPMLKKEAAKKAENMGAKADDLVKEGKIDQNEAVFLSLQYNIELRGITATELPKFERALKKLTGYKGHKVAFRTPEKKRFILHYNTTAKMDDMRTAMNDAITSMGYDVTTYIYARTFQVYISLK